MEQLNWITAEYTIAELKPTGGVVTQRDVLERWKADNPDQEVSAHAGFKCNQQDWNSTVSMRIGIVDKTIHSYGDPGIGTKIEGKVSDPITDPSKPKLLQPGYDELKKKYEKVKREEDTVRRLFDNVRDELETLKKKYNAGVLLRNKLIDDLDETNKQVLKYQEENDRLILRLAEFDQLITVVETVKAGISCPAWNPAKQSIDVNTQPALAYVYGFELSSLQNGEVLAEASKVDEDSADLANAKEVIKSDEDTKPFNAADFQDVDLSPMECDQAEIVGPDEVKTAPLGQNLAGEYSGAHGSEHTGEGGKVE